MSRTCVRDLGADLLLREHLAAETLRASSIHCSVTSVVGSTNLRFLVIGRFDRVGGIGRRGLITLRARGHVSRRNVERLGCVVGEVDRWRVDHVLGSSRVSLELVLWRYDREQRYAPREFKLHSTWIDAVNDRDPQ